MEALEVLQWVTAISTAIIAAAFLILSAVLIRGFSAIHGLKKEISDHLEKKVEVFDLAYRNLLGFESSSTPSTTNSESPRNIPWIVRGLVFATALWKTLKKRR